MLVNRSIEVAPRDCEPVLMCHWMRARKALVFNDYFQCIYLIFFFGGGGGGILRLYNLVVMTL